MKKFCSKCGHQLDLGKRTCTACNAFNPFFISGFINTASVEPVAKVIPEVPVTHEQTMAAEALLAEQSERERMDLTLQNELTKVKEETEQYKRETLDLVKGVQKELQDIDHENKLLKEKVELLKTNTQFEQAEVITPVAAPPAPSQKPGPSKSVMVISVIVLVALAIAWFSYWVVSKGENKVITATGTQTPAVSTATTNLPDKNTIAAVANDVKPTGKLLATVTEPAAKPTTAAQPAVAAAAKPNNTPFSLSTSRAMSDLVGKRLSGCDITINSPSEIEHLDNLVLVEKLSASYIKYKCTVKIKQGSETYTASPYIYYSAEGTFIKVDGTNCE